MIPLFKVHSPSDVGEIVKSVFDKGVLSEGQYSDMFERSFSDLVKNPNTSLTNSGTSALTLAYRMCDIRPGDEVVTTPMTCMATNEPLHTAGAKIVFADIDPSTGNISPQSVERVVTEKTKAVIAVHWAGQPFEIYDVHSAALSKNKNVKFVEDSAHAVGASYCGKPIGSHSDYVCFSFQAIKHLTTVDGGAICSLKKEDDSRVKKLRWFGLDRKYSGSKWEQDIEESGYKFHMNNVNAAIGLAQMRHIDDIISKHKTNGRYYDTHINDSSHVKKLSRNKNSESSYWIYSILVEDIEKFKKHMLDRGISSDIVHVRNDKYSVFKEFRTSDLPGVDEFCSKMVNIPVGWWLSDEDLRSIVSAVNDY